MYYNEHSLSNQQREREVKECIGFERWFLTQVTRVFIGHSMNVAMSTKAFTHDQEWRYCNNRRSTHCQLDARSIRALRFSKQAQLLWNKGVLRLEEPLSANYLPTKSENWARNVVYRSSTLRSPFVFLSQLSHVFLLFCQVKPRASGRNFLG